MSDTTQTSTLAEASAADLPFEEAVKRLQAVVEAMEANDLPLETMLSRFEEGMRLAGICQARLAAAELKVQQLERNAAGEPTLKPLASASDLEAD